MKKKLLVFIVLTGIVFGQDLKTIVEEVLSTNPVVLERLKNYNATKEDITNAESGYYPKLNLTLGGGYENEKRSDRPNVEDRRFKSDVYSGALSYTHNLFQGFETFSQVREHESRTIAAGYSYLEKADDTALRMVETYLEVIKNKELLQNS